MTPVDRSEVNGQKEADRPPGNAVAQSIVDTVLEVATAMAWGATIVLPIAEAVIGEPFSLKLPKRS